MKKTRVHRVNMLLSERSINNAELLSEIIGENNRTRIVASALEIAKSIMEQVDDGKRIIIRAKDGSEQEMKFIIG